MTVAINEIPDSRTLGFTPPTLTTQWVCEGLFSSDDVGSLGYAAIPAIASHPLGLLYRQDVTAKEVGYCLWNLTATYAPAKQVTYRIDFDTLGGTVHVQAGTLRNVYPSTAPNHAGLIGVKGTEVEGCDVVIPAMKIVVHVKHPSGYLTAAQIRYLSLLTGSVDTAGFLVWQPYETLFLGAQGSEGTDVETEVSYHFAMSENLVGATIGGITGITKRGWDVGWIAWKQSTSGTPLKSAPVPDYVNVVAVYKERNLKAVLGFG